MKTFLLTEEHLKLLSKMFVDWGDCESGAPAVDPKRPYGNSDVAGDVAEILGIDYDSDSEDDSVYNSLRKLHNETDTALQIVLATSSFVPGLYRLHDEYDSRSWGLMT